MREALAALELVVVIDVAMTETARLAHYVLPAASQFEKWEATFFNLEFPHNVFQLRAPLFEPLAGHAAGAGDPRRLVRALGRAHRRRPRAAARRGGEGPRRVRRGVLRRRSARTGARNLAPVVLYETLGPTLRRAKKARRSCGARRSTAR